MAGRGDNNKAGSSGRGSGNQSNQGFEKSDKKGKSNHGESTGGKPSVPEKKKEHQSSNRNQNVA